MGKNRGRMGEYRDFGRVWMVGNWGIFGGLRSWDNYGGIWKEWENVG